MKKEKFKIWKFSIINNIPIQYYYLKKYFSENCSSYIKCINNLDNILNKIIYKREKKINKIIFNKNIKSITLIVTDDCNLSCKYCFTLKNSKRNYMSTKIIDNINELKEKNNNLKSIHFFGGEPLLNFSIIKYTCYFAEKFNKSIKYSVFTNGTILSKEIIEIFKKYNFKLLISLDGDLNSHDKNRIFKNGKGTYNIIIKNLKKLIENNIKIIIRTTLTLEINNFNFINDLIKLGINEFRITPLSSDSNFIDIKKYIIHCINLYSILKDLYIEYIKNRIKIKINPFYILLLRIHKKICIFQGCSAGISKISVDMEGNRLPCFRFINFKNKWNQFKKLNKFRNNNICNSCWNKNLCLFFCGAEKLINKNFFEKNINYFCILYKIISILTIKIYNELSEKDKEFLFETKK